MLRIFLFMIGFGLLVLGLSCIILYINILDFGYNFKEYINIILKLPQFYYVIVGLILVNISILKKED